MFTFAVVAARPGRPMPPWVAERLAEPAPDDLPYTPLHHTTWASADGRVRAAAWQDADLLGIGRRWEVRPGGFTAFGGMPWVDATPWSGDVAWAAQLADLFERRPLHEVAPDLDGTCTVVSVAADGTGTVTADPLGMHPLFRGEGDDVVVASNRAALAAALGTPPGRRPARDPEAMAWLVFSGAIQEGRTGFAAVRRVPDGSYLAFGRDRPAEVVTWDERPWWPGPPVPRGEQLAVISGASEDMRALVRVLADLPSRCRKVDLSGGHDSRLVLALLLLEGRQHRCSYVTWGDEAHRDVIVAASLADRYRLDHNSPGRFRPHRRPGPAPGPCPRDDPDLAGWAPGDLEGRPRPGFADAARHHCWVTGGGLSLWDRATAGAPPAENVSITGDMGELLRARFPASYGFATVEAAAAALRAGWLHLDPGGLLRREWREELFRRVEAQLHELRGEGATVQDAMDAYYLRSRLRVWYGANVELDQRNPVTPFARRRVVRAAFSLGAEARRNELLAFLIACAADPKLAKHPFASRGWPPGVVEGLRDADDFPTTPIGAHWRPPRHAGLRAALRRPPRSPRHDPAATPVKDVARQARFDEDRAALEALADQHASAALFDLVDRRALRRALRAGDREVASRRALFDAVTAAIWLDHGEAEVPGLSRRGTG